MTHNSACRIPAARGNLEVPLSSARSWKRRLSYDVTLCCPPPPEVPASDRTPGFVRAAVLEGHLQGSQKGAHGKASSAPRVQAHKDTPTRSRRAPPTGACGHASDEPDLLTLHSIVTDLEYSLVARTSYVFRTGPGRAACCWLKERVASLDYGRLCAAAEPVS